MLWELTLLNRITKQNDFGKIKPRVVEDRLVFVIGDSPKFSTTLCKAQPEDSVPDVESLVKSYIGVDFASDQDELYKYTYLAFFHSVLLFCL